MFATATTEHIILRTALDRFLDGADDVQRRSWKGSDGKYYTSVDIAALYPDEPSIYHGATGRTRDEALYNLVAGEIDCLTDDDWDKLEHCGAVLAPDGEEATWLK